MGSSPARSVSTPASSPATGGLDMDDAAEKTLEYASNPLSEGMEKEEAKMNAIRDKQDSERARQLEKERENDIKGGKDVVDTKYKALEFLLSQSKVCITTLLLVGRGLTTMSAILCDHASTDSEAGRSRRCSD